MTKPTFRGRLLPHVEVHLRRQGYVTSREAAQAAGLHHSSILRFCDAVGVPTTAHGHHRLVHLQSLMEARGLGRPRGDAHG
jgi:hypothetical protein